MSELNVVVRADASRRIGSGHMARCATLADELQRNRVARVVFVVRAGDGDMIDVLSSSGFGVRVLPSLEPKNGDQGWLGVSEATDVDETLTALGRDRNRIDWVIVDHYGIGASWERRMATAGARLLVIDDLADRNHACEVLVDQTVGRNAADYRELVPPDCQLLLGSSYALLRPEFRALRSASLQRRSIGTDKPSILLNFGGVDQANAAGRVLALLRNERDLPAFWGTVVLGRSAPHLSAVRHVAASMPGVRVLHDVTDMARLMVDADMAIGAGGTTSWERCCMGLPTLIVSVAANQQQIAENLHEREAAYYCGTLAAIESDPNRLLRPLLKMLKSPHRVQRMSRAAARVVDGLGTARVAEQIVNFHQR